MSRKVTQIQNRESHECHMTIISSLITVAGLGEFRIRDLNDEINKLLREKRHWEDRIIELGGPDYNVSSRPGLHIHFFIFLFLETWSQDVGS